MKYLIAGLGNIGPEYRNTRHNIGFRILDAFAEASNITFEDKRYGYIADYRYKARSFILLKPATYMNRSGLAVNYWLKKANIPLENMLVFVDDIALPFGTIRIRPKGGDGGHNGLTSLIEVLGSNDFARVRFGIGNDFKDGQQVNYVLDELTAEEEELLPAQFSICSEIIKSFGTIGLELTMTTYNKK